MLEPAVAASLAVVAAAVGLFIGTVGVGGVLLIPFLVLLGGLGIHSAAATALFTFLFTGLLGTWLFQKRGSIDWRLALPVCVGALPCGYLGANAAARLDSRPLTLIIAGIIIAAGIYVFRPAAATGLPRRCRSHGELALLFAVGLVSGFGAGLSGAGGPLFAVPLMVILGFAPLAAVGVSQVLQILAATSGSLASMQDSRIAYGIAAWVTLFQLAGVVAGVRLAHVVSARVLRGMAATLCIVVGGFMLVRAL